jgi:hypothetical protein
MKKLTELTLALPEVVDDTTKATLERWGLTGASGVSEREDLVGALTEIERMVGREEGAYRQTLLVDWCSPGSVSMKDEGGCVFYGLWDARGRLLVRYRVQAPHLPEVGRKLHVQGGGYWKVLSTEKMYEGESVAGVLCEVEQTWIS